jgi:hypothetical protein
MVFNYTSCEGIIAELISRTKMTDSTYADDLLVWIGQGLNMLRVITMLQPATKEVEIRGGVGELPCNLVYLDGIAYNGARLRQGTGIIDTRVCKDGETLINEDFDSYFVSDPTDEGYINNSQDYRLIRGLDLKQASSYGSTSDYYLLFPNHIQTSFLEGTIVVFYRKMATDKRGYPLIPDDENIRFALFWWLMANLTFGGYKHADPKMDYDYCEAKFKHYGRLGKNKLKEWTIDRRQAVLEMTVSLIPPMGYYDSFFIGGEQAKGIRK